MSSAVHLRSVESDGAGFTESWQLTWLSLSLASERIVCLAVLDIVGCRREVRARFVILTFVHYDVVAALLQSDVDLEIDGAVQGPEEFNSVFWTFLLS